MKTLTEIYQQIKEASVLPNTGANRPRSDSNMTSGGGRSYAAGSVPQPSPKEFVDGTKNDYKAGADAIRPTPGNISSTPLKTAGKPTVTGLIAKARENKKVDDYRPPEAPAKPNMSKTGSPHALAKTPAERAAEYGHAVKSTPPKPQTSPGSLGKAQRVRADAKAIVAKQSQERAYASGENTKAIDNAKSGRTAQPTQATAQVSRIKSKPPEKGTAQAATPPAKPQASPGSAGSVAKPPATSKPPEKEQSFAQAFAAARKKAGGAGGVFKWKDPKTGKVREYQTNVKGEKYLKRSKLKPVSETMDHKELYKKVRDIIAEAEKHVDSGVTGAKKSSRETVFKNTLGALEKRKWSGGQKRDQNSYKVGKSVVSETNTDTGETGDEITVNPKEKPKSNNTINNSSSTTTTNQ
jgi:hypothetical protein